MYILQECLESIKYFINIIISDFGLCFFLARILSPHEALVTLSEITKAITIIYNSLIHESLNYYYK
jgi:hypothetical protein